jgi:simple sugar transport system ATP-binding protein
VLIAANPCFGLDFAAVAQIHAEIVEARNRGAAVLLVSEDLDELLELADRIVVMFNGRLVYESPASDADLVQIGRHMAGHWPIRYWPLRSTMAATGPPPSGP